MADVPMNRVIQFIGYRRAIPLYSTRLQPLLFKEKEKKPAKVFPRRLQTSYLMVVTPFLEDLPFSRIDFTG